MVELSILNSYMPDLGDLFLLIISVLLGVITLYSKQHVSQMKTFMRENAVDHMNIEKRLVDVDTWTKVIHKTQIEPTLEKANINEKKIIDMRMDIRNHEGRIKRVEERIG